MPVEVYPRVTIGGQDFYRTETLIPVDYDPDRGVILFVGTPTGGLGVFGPLIKGDPGFPPTFDEPTLFSLAASDPTPDSIVRTLVTPATDIAGPVYHDEVYMHRGEDGEDGVTSIDLDSIGGTVGAGKTIVVNSGATGFDFQTIKVGDRYYPASYNSISSGNATATLGQVALGPFAFDVRVEVHGEAIITPTSSDVAVDVLARLDNASSGNVIGRGLGVANQASPHVLSPGVLAGDVTAGGADYDKITAGDTKTIYFRGERQAGTGYFTTQASRTIFWAKANPIP